MIEPTVNYIKENLQALYPWDWTYYQNTDGNHAFRNMLGHQFSICFGPDFDWVSPSAITITKHSFNLSNHIDVKIVLNKMVLFGLAKAKR